MNKRFKNLKVLEISKSVEFFRMNWKYGANKTAEYDLNNISLISTGIWQIFGILMHYSVPILHLTPTKLEI